MLSAVFFEKAVWAFFALVLSLIAVIYKLFNGSLQKDLKIQKEAIKDELENKFEIKFEIKFNKKIDDLEDDIKALNNDIASFKKHENNNSTHQNKLLDEILEKLKRHNNKIQNDLKI